MLLPLRKGEANPLFATEKEKIIIGCCSPQLPLDKSILRFQHYLENILSSFCIWSWLNHYISCQNLQIQETAKSIQQADEVTTTKSQGSHQWGRTDGRPT